jgi:hypothetical protein
MSTGILMGVTVYAVISLQTNLIDIFLGHTEVSISSDLKETSKQSVSSIPVDIEEEEEDYDDKLRSDDVVNCICQINEENGLMIQVRFLFVLILSHSSGQRKTSCFHMYSSPQEDFL